VKVRGQALKKIFLLLFFCTLYPVPCTLFLSGCGYTTKSLLPTHIKSVYIENFKNSIDITEEVSNKKPYTIYSRGLENELTEAVSARFISDGNLRVVRHPDEADAVISGELLAYMREPLRYDDDQDVTEYRVSVEASVKFLDKKDNKIVWEAGRFSGESSQRTEGGLQKTEETARQEAVDDLARRIVERTIEVW
jgi:hypothetical protein